MKPLIVLTMLVLYLPLSGQNEPAPTLDQTIDYMADMLDTAGTDQKILFGGDYRKEACRLFISDTITYAVVKPSRIYNTEVQFHLGTIDPKSVKIEEKARTVVAFETTNYQSVVWESASKWKETKGKIPEILELSATPAYRFRFMNPQAAEHFAKAFSHAVELCGGKKSEF